MAPGEPGPVLKPDDADQVLEVVAWAAAEEAPLEIVGGGTKRGLGRPLQASHELDLSALDRITLYEPEELVLSAGAGTPMMEIEAALAGHRQQLAFEPPDLGPLYGGEPGRQTLGGVIACNPSGPRRLKAGAARDHFLGVRAVSGRGEAFKAGGRVMKNVTGYDMCKLLCGSHGTLAVLTEVTVKVLPAAETVHTVLVFGLDDAAAIRAMARALTSAHEVSGAAHLPAEPAAGSAVSYLRDARASVTALRVEGPRPSVLHRTAALKALMADTGAVEELHGKNSALMWRELGDVAPFAAAPERQIWRLSVPPASGAKVVAAIGREVEARAFYDWGGGLVWLALPPSDDAGDRVVRGAIAETGGHATLMRAPAPLRAAVPVFQPQDAPLAALSARIKAGFDPRGVLNPGRMYAEG